jgi:hypothetical protein
MIRFMCLLGRARYHGCKQSFTGIPECEKVHGIEKASNDRMNNTQPNGKIIDHNICRRNNSINCQCSSPCRFRKNGETVNISAA